MRGVIADGLADALLIGMSVAWLWLFSNIWRDGEFLAAEPSILIRGLETAGFILILAFGISRFIRHIKEIRR